MPITNPLIERGAHEMRSEETGGLSSAPTFTMKEAERQCCDGWEARAIKRWCWH